MDPPIIIGEQTPLHWNNSNEKATFSFKKQDVFVKENHYLCRESVSISNEIANNENIKVFPEIEFKNKNRNKLSIGWQTLIPPRANLEEKKHLPN